MKLTDKTIRLFACVAAALFIAACSQAPKPSTPEPTPDPAVSGERLMRSMSDTLAQSKAFTFETSEQLEAIAPSGEKRMVHFTRKVTVRRPNGLFFELHGKADAPLEVDAYYDGRTVSLNEKGNGKWAQTAVPGTLDEMLDDVATRFGLPIPIGDVVYSSPYDAFIGSSSKGGVVGQETIDGVPCSKLDYADDLVQVRLWLPTSGQPLPRRLEIVYKKAPTPLTTQLNLSNWNLNAPVTDSTFAFQPPTSKAIEFGDFTKGLVKRVVPAAPQVASAADTGSKSAGAPKTRLTREGKERSMKMRWWIAGGLMAWLLVGSTPIVQSQRDRGFNQPGAAGNRGTVGRDAGVNQPGAVGNVGRDPGVNQPGAVGNYGGSARQTRVRDPGFNQPGAVGNRRL